MEHPDRVAVRSGEEILTYRELWIQSGYLADIIRDKYPSSGQPVPVYGHKSPWMLAGFLACARAGHAYCPLDVSIPAGRLQEILSALPAGILLAAEELPTGAGITGKFDVCIMKEAGKDALKDRKDSSGTDCFPIEADKEIREREGWVKPEETFYIIFTSGSTGKPKGVQITLDCLNHFLDWSVSLCPSCGSMDMSGTEGLVFLNQAPFSFDLSVMDLYTCLACQGTLFCLDKRVQQDYRLLMKALGASRAQVWVSTPSFADVCLADPAFSQDLLPEMELFLFCGETLANKTAARLMKRFPKAEVVNTYGPTESTVAVTGVRITPEMAAGKDPLPVGRAKPGTQIRIQSENGEELADGNPGEVVIVGDTVSIGYYRMEEKTAQAFFLDPVSGLRGYHTGDKGLLREGMLYYHGRMDLQIKLHGYRMELEDIEANLCRLPQVKQAVVVPAWRGGKVSSLTGYLVLGEGGDLSAGCTGKADFDAKEPADEQVRTEERLKGLLREFLPDYMIPRRLIVIDRIPMTPNGKADRKALAGKTV